MPKKAESKTLVKQPDFRESEITQLISQAIDKNVPVETMEKLLAMRRELRAEFARNEFQKSLAAFQAACPVIKKTKVVMNKDGKTERYRYAPIESIVEQVKDLLQEHGFNHRTDAKIEARVVSAVCVITHREGHEEKSSFAVPIDPDAYMNEAQKFASALTFAKRYAFCDALGIITGDEDYDTVTVSTASQPREKHSRTKTYEETPADANTHSADDLVQLQSFMSENDIPEGFLLRLLQEKKLIDGHTKSVAQVKPGILRRCLDEKSKANLLAAWRAQQADEESGSATPPPKKQERHPFDSGTPDREPLGKSEPKRKTAKREAENEDQRREPTRVFCQADMSPHDYLEQEGADDWRKVKIHFGEKEGTALGKLSRASLEWWIENWQAKPYKGTWEDDTVLLDAALCVAAAELENA